MLANAFLALEKINSNLLRRINYCLWGRFGGCLRSIFRFCLCKQQRRGYGGGGVVIELQIENSEMTVNGESFAIDENGTAPVIVEGRTLLPVMAVIETVGGEVSRDEESGVVAISTGSAEDEEETDMTAEAETDVSNVVEAETAEAAEGDVVTEAGGTITADGAASVVYFTSDISSEGLMAAYEMSGFEPEGNAAIKLSTGEAVNTRYLDPNLIKDLVQSVDGTIVEYNTACGGSRAETAMYRQVAEDHGFTNTANVDIMDEEGSMEIPVEGGSISVDCGCDGNPAEPEMNDVGILASTDPVAPDQACVDIVYVTDGTESGALIERIESRNGLYTLEQAEKIGLGSRTYRLVSID